MKHINHIVYIIMVTVRLVRLYDLNIPDIEMWKYVDSTIFECVAKNHSSSIQSVVDVFDKNASNDNFQLIEGKCVRVNDRLFY